MRKRSIAFALSLLLTFAAQAGPYDLAICPIIRGDFFLLDGQLWIEIFKQDGKPVERRREKIANPLDEKSHEALSKRGPLTVEVHQDKDGKGLFVHWGTLDDDE
jgi:hypothetical protein